MNAAKKKKINVGMKGWVSYVAIQSDKNKTKSREANELLKQKDQMSRKIIFGINLFKVSICETMLQFNDNLTNQFSEKVLKSQNN